MTGVTIRGLPYYPRSYIAYAHDVVMAAASFLLAFYLRVGDLLFTNYRPEVLLQGTLAFALIAAGVFWSIGLYRGMWRYASMNDLLQIAKAVTLVVLIFVPVAFLATRGVDLPRSQPLINWFVLVVLLGGPRFAYRLLKDRRLDLRQMRDGGRRVPVLLVGSGDEAETFIRAMERSRDAAYRVVGVLDEKNRRVGMSLRHAPILGGAGDLGAVVRMLAERGDKVQRVIVAEPRLAGERIRALLDESDRLGLTLARLPRLTDFRSGAEDGIEPQPIALEDLLGRPQTVLDRRTVKALIDGRRVLITGAGGTIGGELARQIAELGPDSLALLDQSEFNLYAIDLALAQANPRLRRGAYLADVRDLRRLDQVFAETRPEIVFHAAALKHVPIVEAHPIDGILTNVVGTRHVAEACSAHRARAMVLISTDKAVNPASVMGATKRAAESYCQALDLMTRRSGRGPTRFLTVRFGNVLGSTGSVVPLFQQQIARGGPVTVTHSEVTRYFMTVREAVELVLQAAAIEDGPAGRILVLEMGAPVRIVDLARQMIRLSGRRQDEEIRIEFVGLRPGEKLHEELFHAGEAIEPTAVEGVMAAAPRTADLPVLARALDELTEAARQGDDQRALALLRRLVPEFAQAHAAEPPRPAAHAR